MANLEALRGIRHQAEVLGNRVRAAELVLEALPDADPELRHHLQQYRRWLERQAAEPGPGGVSVHALLLDVDHQGDGFVARLALEPRTELHRGPLPGGCGAAFAEAVERAGAALMGSLTRRGLFSPTSAMLADQRLTLQGPAAARHWVKDGGSIGAAVAVLFYAAWTGTEVPPEVAVTGGVDARGQILPVGGLEAKVSAVLRERPGVRLVVVPRMAGPGPRGATPGGGQGEKEPARSDPRVRAVGTMEELLEVVFGPRALAARTPGAVDIEGTVRLGTELYEKQGSFAFAARVLTAALEAVDAIREAGDRQAHRQDELLAAWRLGSSLIHLGQTTEAEAQLGRARALARRLWDEGELDPRHYVGFRGNLAVLWRDTFRPAEAEALLRENLSLQRQLRQDKREQAKTLGNLGELLTFMGRFAEAEQLLNQALELIRATYPEEVPRELCYLGNLHLRRGEPGGALELFRQGLLANARVQYGRQANEAFLRLGAVRALAGCGRHGRAVAEADRALDPLPPSRPYPRAVILKHRALSLLAQGETAAGRQGLQEAADTTFASGALLRFGISTALGELAIHLLASEQEGHRARARSLAAQLAQIARQVPGLDPARSGAAEVMRLAGEQPLDAARLEQALVTTCAWFYYG